MNEGCYYTRIQSTGGTQFNRLVGNTPHIKDIALIPDLRVPPACLFVNGIPSITWWWCREYGRDFSTNGKWSTTIGDDVIRKPMEAHNIR